MPKLSKFDIQMAVSAIKIKNRKIFFHKKKYRVSPSDCHVKNRHISASEPLEKLYDEANESYLAAVFAHIND